MPMKIVQILPDLHVGGAERVAVNLANTWAAWGHNVEFVLMQSRGEFKSLVDSDILIQELGCNRMRFVPFRLASRLRTSNPDVTLAHMWPLTSLAVLAWLLAGRPGKLYLCEHTVLGNHYGHDLGFSILLLMSILRLSHRHATGVVAVSAGVSGQLSRLAALPEHLVKTIYNPIVDERMISFDSFSKYSLRETLWRGKFTIHLLAVGSLVDLKNHRLLIAAFSKIAHRLDAALVILGEGPLRFVLEQDVKNFSLEDRVVLAGFQSDPTFWYQCADLFVLTSNYEGFANVLVESLACGTPVVSTDCPYGPSEILMQGLYGELVPVGDIDALAAGVQRAINRQWDHASLKLRALEFSIPAQSGAYIKLFNNQ